MQVKYILEIEFLPIGVYLGEDELISSEVRTLEISKEFADIIIAHKVISTNGSNLSQYNDWVDSKEINIPIEEKGEFRDLDDDLFIYFGTEDCLTYTESFVTIGKYIEVKLFCKSESIVNYNSKIR